MVKFDEVISSTKLQPRPYQARIVQSVYNMFTGQHKNGKGEIELAAKSVMVESPTGSGKTSMGLMGSKMLQMSMPDLQVLWVAMRRNLLTQAEKENAAKNIGVRNIQFVSMFQKNVVELVNKDRPTLIVVDECLAGETLVSVLVDGEPALVPISDVVDNGVGSHALSYDVVTGTVEWMPIVSRVCTGVRDVFEVEVEVEDGSVIRIVATDNHRFFVDGDYKRLDELVVGDAVVVKDSASFKKDAHHDAIERQI
jgi:hypothetical protein